MAGGNLNLASSRSGEDIININPQITFFKKVYKRHTNFGIETQEVTSDTSPSFGSKITFNIDSYGSLISSMHYEFTLSNMCDNTTYNNRSITSVSTTNTIVTDLGNVSIIENGFPRLIRITQGTGYGRIFRVKSNTNGALVIEGKDKDSLNMIRLVGTDSKFTLESNSAYRCKYLYFVNNVGHAILNNTELIIDNTIIDKHTGVWLDIWNELTDSNRKEWSMLGKRDSDMSDNFKKGFTDFGGKTRFYVPLKFYMNRNPGLAFPLFLLGDNSTNVTITLNQKKSLVVFELNDWAKAVFENNTGKLPQTDAGLANNQIKLEVGSNAGDNYYVGTNNISYVISLTKTGFLTEDRVIIGYDGTSKIATVDTAFSVIPDNTYRYSIIKRNYPDLSELVIENFKFYTTYIFLESAEENRIRANLPNEYLIETLILNENISNNTLSKIDNLTNPIKELVWVLRNNTRITTYSGRTEPKRLYINNRFLDKNIPSKASEEYCNDIFNYSFHRINVALDYGTRDPINSVKLLISSQARVETTDSTFFRTIQPYNHHSNIPGGINSLEKKRYIYVYSFALNPEEYQPSGSYNFSKDNDFLTMNITSCSDDGLQALTGIPSGYSMNLYALGYKFLSVSDNSINLQDVPVSQAVFTEKQIEVNTGQPVTEEQKEKQVEIKEEKQVIDAKVEEAKKIEREIRYIEKPHTHGHYGKKRWGGLQDEYFKQI